jgi:hypothetical protein
VSLTSFAKIHEFETTHLKSKGGTGVAGIFMEEAAFLNPATLAFFDANNIYVQRDVLEFKNSNGVVTQKPKSTAVVISDGNPTLSGSLSYVFQEEGTFKRKRWGLSTSSPINEKSAFGVSFRKSEDTNTLDNSKKDYYQTVFGVTHAIDAQTSFGVVLYDAFASKADAVRAMAGFQHIFADTATIAFDASGNYNSDEISKTVMYRGSVQIKVLNDFYIRVGAFNDKSLSEKGNGFGLSWIQPRLAFEFAIKNTKQQAVASLGRAETKLKESSFGASIRF